MKWSEFAVSEARQTLVKWECRSFTVSPPIPVEDIADLLYFLAIDITDTLPANIAGQLYVDDRIIVVKKTDAHVRQRFTIAHEIGHFVLHVVAEGLLRNEHSCTGECVDAYPAMDSLGLPGIEASSTAAASSIRHKQDEKRLEIEANCFAAEILMPASLVEAAVEQHGTDSVALARLFDVSPQAMRFRLEKLLFLPPPGPQPSLLLNHQLS